MRDSPRYLRRKAARHMRFVLVNGTPIRADGQQVNTDLRPGRLVRPAARQLARGAR